MFLGGAGGQAVWWVCGSSRYLHSGDAAGMRGAALPVQPAVYSYMAWTSCSSVTLSPELGSLNGICCERTAAAQASGTWIQLAPQKCWQMPCMLADRYVCVTQGGSWAVAYMGPDTATKLRQLRPGAVYQYRVSASNCEGTSAYSEAAANAQPLLPPPPPTNVAAQLDTASPASSE